jgi:hypothetical protein
LASRALWNNAISLPYIPTYKDVKALGEDIANLVQILRNASDNNQLSPEIQCLIAEGVCLHLTAVPVSSFERGKDVSSKNPNIPSNQSDEV